MELNSLPVDIVKLVNKYIDKCEYIGQIIKVPMVGRYLTSQGFFSGEFKSNFLDDLVTQMFNTLKPSELHNIFNVERCIEFANSDWKTFDSKKFAYDIILISDDDPRTLIPIDYSARIQITGTRIEVYIKKLSVSI